LPSKGRINIKNIILAGGIGTNSSFKFNHFESLELHALLTEREG
jgi:hypothetical protein